MAQELRTNLPALAMGCKELSVSMNAQGRDPTRGGATAMVVGELCNPRIFKYEFRFVTTRDIAK